MERKTLARWLVVSALACFGFVLGAGVAQAQDGTTVQGTQSSTRSDAQTGDATGTNNSQFNGGPTANGGAGANAQQLGTNSGSVSQSGSASTGDPVAGGQVTGVVADNVTVQNSNSAVAPRAVSGDATVTNRANVNLGPQAIANGTTQVAQSGDNIADVSQSGTATTGDAVAGAQVTGIVGDGEHIVQNQNSAFGAIARSGDATVFNRATVFVGPRALSRNTAQVGQIGDNDAVISQAAEVWTGDAVAGSQITGIVGGSATVQNQNSSTRSRAVSGVADAENIVRGAVAPLAFSTGRTAQATQSGDNTADIAQDVQGGSGDAVAGGQVTGAVGDQGGFLTVQNQQASENDFARSGDVNLSNLVGQTISFGPFSTRNFVVGPTALAPFGRTANVSQNGDNDVAIAQNVEGETGDAVAGAQVTGAVGYSDVTIMNSNSARNPRAISGEFDDNGVENNNVFAAVGPLAVSGRAASASQNGDNSVSIDQVVIGSTGDAVAGAQVTGVVATGSTVVVMNQNSSINAFARSGEVDDAENVVALDALGPTAVRFGFGAGSAQASQNGSNELIVSQVAEGWSGDAVAGSQVTGVVAGDNADITVMNSNSSVRSTARSGDIDDVENAVFANVGPAAFLATGLFGGAGSAQVTQNGDNLVAIDQVVEGASGDAVAGAQVTGVVAGDNSEITVMNSNSSVRDLAVSGEFDMDGDGNEINVNVGPVARRFGDGAGAAMASQSGDNELVVSQSIAGASGDAVAGSQVTGVVAGDGSEITVMNQNSAVRATARSGEVDDFENEVEARVGPSAVRAFGDGPGGAHASQNGDNVAEISQTIAAETGDAVAGAQVTGVVAGDGSEVTVMNSNSSVRSRAASGDIDTDTENEVRLAVGPVARRSAGFGAGEVQASQIGDNVAIVDQALAAETGDAVAGSQVTGVVAGDNSEVTVMNSNSSVRDLALSGQIEDVENDLIINAVGPRATRTGRGAGAAQATQSGDNAVVVSQLLAAATGDAVAGSQVTGVVAGDDSEITVMNQNSAFRPTAISGEIDLTNDGNIALIRAVGPQATRTPVGAAMASQNGDNSVVVDQTLVAETGDAVAGSQVTGIVAGEGSEITVMNSNSSFRAFARSGRVDDATNVLRVNIGPTAFARAGVASASQNGDNTLDFAQDIAVASGDAVAGSQVTGVVGGEATISVMNDDTRSDARSGVTEATNNASGTLTASATSDRIANVSVNGDTGFSGSQALSSESGDAVSGGQITGDVGTVATAGAATPAGVEGTGAFGVATTA